MPVSKKILTVVFVTSLIGGTVVAQQFLSTSPAYFYPAIKNYGKVVQFPAAPHQPRNESKIVVDVTKGGDPAELNDGIGKIARFVNIYAGAGKEPAAAKISVVLHGDATLTVLKPEVYAKRFETEGNPNLDCLRELRKAGVEILVCGQALTGKGAHSSEVADEAVVAVSGLTALVNLQADGYSYVPLLK